jgi:hypothetical protein
MADPPMKIADLFSKCSELAALEEKEMRRIASTILPVLGWLNEPVVLLPESLGSAFEQFRSVTLETGATVVMTDFHGKVSSMQLSKFRTQEYLAILRDSFPELQRLAANKRRSGEVRPALLLKVVLGGPRFIVDMRSCRLIVANTGGDCVDIRVTTLLRGDRTKASRPCDVGRGEKAEVDLGVSKEVAGSGRLELRIDCKDVDGRELGGEESVRLDGAASWQEATLLAKEEKLGSGVV